MYVELLAGWQIVYILEEQSDLGIHCSFIFWGGWGVGAGLLLYCCFTSMVNSYGHIWIIS